VNLKWLSVVENKLQSLNGIEALTKLTVSSTDITELVSLRFVSLTNSEVLQD